MSSPLTSEAERFAQVRRTFDEVAYLAPDARAERLRALAPPPDVIAEVEALLAAAAVSHTQFSKPIAHALDELTSDDAAAGDQLGAWRLEEEIGHGGMGKVFRAQRSDGHFEQRAAVKVLRGIPSPLALDHLARERQILAGLPHPNIARLLDGGATPKGHPYLVMEFIEGVPLDEFVRDRKLTQAATLRLFTEICDAVSFAHRQLIVHCDLKPANVLVEASGRPVLLDFGIARLHDAEGEGSADANATPAYTPRYASPEQRSNAGVSTLSDVFSLGRILSELVGESPHAELAAIVARATKDDPLARYGSVDALAADVRRFLARKPVEAMPATPAYVARKFAQRNWPWLAAAVFFLGTVAAFTWQVTSERDRAHEAEVAALRERDRAANAETRTAQERDRAVTAESAATSQRDNALRSEQTAVSERNRATISQGTSEQLNAFLLSIFENPDLAVLGSPDTPAVKIVDAASARVARELSDQPQTQAEIYGALGAVYGSLGQPVSALENYDRAIAIERKLARPLRLAKLLAAKSDLRMLRGDQMLAEPESREALALRVKYAGAESREAADSYHALGALLIQRAQFREADELLRKAVPLREKFHGKESLELAQTRLVQGKLSRYLSDAAFREGEGYLRTAMGISRRIGGEKHPLYIECLEVLAERYVMNRPDDALALAREALALRVALHGAQNDHVYGATMVMGRAHLGRGRPVEAIAAFESGLAIHESLGTTRRTAYANALGFLGNACLVSGDFACAERRLQQALAIMRANFRGTNAVLARHERFLALVFLRTGRASEAGPLLAAALQTQSDMLGDGYAATIDTRSTQAWQEALTGRDPAAARFEALQADVQRQPAHRQLEFLRYRGLAYAAGGRFEPALSDLESAQNGWMRYYGDNELTGYLIALDRAEVLAMAGRSREAAQLAQLISVPLEARLPATSTFRRTLARLRNP